MRKDTYAGRYSGMKAYNGFQGLVSEKNISR
jgi:hypothetical protein